MPARYAFVGRGDTIRLILASLSSSIPQCDRHLRRNGPGQKPYPARGASGRAHAEWLIGDCEASGSGRVRAGTTYC